MLSECFGCARRGARVLDVEADEDIPRISGGEGGKRGGRDLAMGDLRLLRR